VIFDALERELLADLERLVFSQHVAIASTSHGQPFTDEIDHARSAFTRHGRLTTPWLQWGPEKTLANLWEAQCERQKDPKYRAMVQRIQQKLDTDADKIAAAVEEELQLRLKASTYSRELEAASKKSIGRRHGRVSRRKRGRA
jgi:hypothetical protein